MPGAAPMIAASGTISTPHQDDFCENELLAKIRDEPIVGLRRRVPGPPSPAHRPALPSVNFSETNSFAKTPTNQ
jgi:hypothetical protein